jgi:hypothetical protein
LSSARLSGGATEQRLEDTRSHQGFTVGDKEHFISTATAKLQLAEPRGEARHFATPLTCGIATNGVEPSVLRGTSHVSQLDLVIAAFSASRGEDYELIRRV